jgi:hypothetical protein
MQGARWSVSGHMEAGILPPTLRYHSRNWEFKPTENRSGERNTLMKALPSRQQKVIGTSATKLSAKTLEMPILQVARNRRRMEPYS